jgi:hypothetical protein
VGEQGENTYSDALPLRQARELYFERSGIGREYEVPWVKLRVGPIPIWFPNTKARVRAARLHDLHHIATTYPTTWRGEAEIGAWEIASGCGRYFAAWYLNVMAFAIGVLLWPREVHRAFVRGRSSESLYHEPGGFREEMLEQSVGALRARLRLAGAERAARPADNALFAGWALLGLIHMSLLPALLLVAWL